MVMRFDDAKSVEELFPSITVPDLSQAITSWFTPSFTFLVFESNDDIFQRVFMSVSIELDMTPKKKNFKCILGSLVEI